jgi:hypothetical protein
VATEGMLIGKTNNYGSSCCVNLVTNTARYPRCDGVSNQIGPKASFRNPSLKLLYFKVRQKTNNVFPFFKNVFLSENLLANLFSQATAEKVSIFR